MGYDPNISPGPRWFAIQSYAKDALTFLAQKPSEGKEMRSLSVLYKVRLDLARAILAFFGGVADSGDIKVIFRKAIELGKNYTYIEDFFRGLIDPGFTVTYSGTSQYSVPNYTLCRGDETEYGTGPLGPLFADAYAERLAHAMQLQRALKHLLFNVYWTVKKNDLTYCSHWEPMEPEEILETVVNAGLFPSTEAALAACNNEIGALCSLPAVNELGAKLQKDHWRDYHHESILTFREEDSIWHSHAD